MTYLSALAFFLPFMDYRIGPLQTILSLEDILKDLRHYEHDVCITLTKGLPALLRLPLQKCVMVDRITYKRP